MFEALVKRMPKYFVIAFLLAPYLAIGQQFHFNHLTTEDGLPTGNVRCITQDYQGFFWFGTEDGLVRYDGYEMTVYRYEKSDATSISGNFILKLFEDSQKRLWIGTLNAGVCLYDRDRDSFIRLRHDPKKPNSLGYDFVRDFYETSKGELFIGFKNNSLSKIDLNQRITSQAEFVNLKMPFEYDENTITWGTSIIEQSNDKLLIAVNGAGMFELDKRDMSFSNFHNENEIQGIQKLFLDSKSRLWIGTWNNGLFVFSSSRKKMRHFTETTSIPIPDNQVEVITEDSNGNIWIGTDNGLVFIKNNENPFDKPEFQKITYSAYNPFSIMGNSIKDIYVDENDRVWATSYFGGINIFDKEMHLFNPIRSSAYEKNRLRSNNVVAFAEGKDSNLWVGTDGGGIHFVQGGAKNLWGPSFYQIPELARIRKAKSLAVDRRGNLWIGTWGQGIFQWSGFEKSLKQYIAGDNDINLTANEIMGVVCEGDSVWIGTFSAGVNLMNQSTGKIKRYRQLLESASGEKVENDKTNVLFIDSKKKLWVGTEASGLYYYFPDEDRFIQVINTYIKENSTILCIEESSDGLLWFGTNKSGLVRYNPDNKDVMLFDKESGLPSVVIKAIVERKGRIWIGSNKGLSVLDTETSKITNFGSVNGIQGNEFNEAFAYSDGMLLFGGINGMNAFYPDNILINKRLPNIVFTKFWMNNIQTGISDAGSPLEESVMVTDEIVLDYNQRSFSVGYAALSYTFDDRIDYAYMLEGFHDDWQLVGKERKATFTNLSPNNYTLRVKSSNSAGFWGDNQKSVSIVLLPAWWQTIWFKIFVVLVLMISILSFIRYRTYSFRKTQIDLEKLVASRTTEVRKLNENLELSNTKLLDQKNDLEKIVSELKSTKNQLAVSEKMASLGVFTAGIAHEINNPVNFISGANQKLIDLIEAKEKEEGDSKDVIILKELAHIMNVGIERTVQIVNSLRNYSRNQPGKFENYNIVHCIEDSLLILSHKIKNASIEVKKDYPDRLYLDCLPGRISQIFVNLISNAIDAIDGGGSIKIALSYIEDQVVIEVTDDGVGINDEDISKLFDPFYSTKEVGKGSGLGLYIVYGIVVEHDGSIDVIPQNPGTKFKITLPKAQKTQRVKPNDIQAIKSNH